MTQNETYHLIGDTTIEAITTQIKTMRRAASRMNESDEFQTTAAIDNIEGMIKRDTFLCNVSPNFDIDEVDQ